MDSALADVALPLRDIHLPEAISWWPPAPGWWLLCALAIIFSVLVWWWLRHKAQTKVREVALVEWQQLMEVYQQQKDVNRLVQGLSILLRRVCLSYYPREAVAGLSGEAWLRYLDQTHPQRNAFSEGVGRLLLDAPYRPQVEGDVQALHALCGEWLSALPPLKRGQR